MDTSPESPQRPLDAQAPPIAAPTPRQTRTMRATRRGREAGLDLHHLALATQLRRRLEGLAVEDVAAVLDLSATTIRRVEAGQVIDLESFVVVARWLGLSADELLGLTPKR